MIDQIDKKMLQILQKDAGISLQSLAKKVDLSTTPCWKRLRKLEEKGVVKKRVVLVDPVKVGCNVMIFVSIKVGHHDPKWQENFHKIMHSMPEVIEMYRMSGELDYMLRVALPNINSYDNFYKKLISQVDLADVRSSFAIENIKYSTQIPIYTES